MEEKDNGKSLCSPFDNTTKGIEVKKSIIRDLALVLNKHSVDVSANVPDFIMAEYLFDSLSATFALKNKNLYWYGEK
jgi:hypothetical protein